MEAVGAAKAAKEAAWNDATMRKKQWKTRKHGDKKCKHGDSDSSNHSDTDNDASPASPAPTEKREKSSADRSAGSQHRPSLHLLMVGLRILAVGIVMFISGARGAEAASEGDCGGWLCEGQGQSPPLWALRRAGEGADYCDIDILTSGANRTSKWYQSLAWSKRPFVVRGGVSLDSTQKAWTKPKIMQLARQIQLKANWGRSDTIPLNAGEGPNQGKMLDFLAEHMHKSGGPKELLDRPYVFQRFGGKGFELPKELRWLPWRTSFFMVGAEGSGVGWHRHHAAAQLPVFGRKRWLLLPPSTPPAGGGIGFWPLFDWLRTVLPTIKDTPRAPQECIVSPGDTIYIPENWYHAVVNAGGDSVAVSLQHDKRHAQASKELVAKALNAASSPAVKAEALRGLLKLEPADVDSRYSLAGLLLHKGAMQDLPEAVRHLEIIIRQDPWHVNAMYLWFETVRHLEKIARQDPWSANAMYLWFSALGGSASGGGVVGSNQATKKNTELPASLLELLQQFEPYLLKMSSWSLLANRMLHGLYHDTGRIDDEISSLNRAAQMQEVGSGVLPGPFPEVVDFAALLHEAEVRQSRAQEEL